MDLKVCDFIFILLLFITLLVSVWGLVIGTVKKDYSKDVPEKYQKFAIKRDAFLRISYLLLCVGYFLEVGSIISTISVLYISAFDKDDTVRIFVYSSFSLIFIFANLVIQPKKISTAYRNAFVRMDTRINKSIVQENDCSDNLAKELFICEKIIANGHGQDLEYYSNFDDKNTN